MTIGIPKEVKTDEFRVGLTPLNVASLVQDGHSLFIQSCAGEGSGFSDFEYIDAGAKIVEGAEELYASATLIVKVKEPQPSEYDFLNSTHTLFCYLHLAPLPELVSVLIEKEVCAIAYETVAVENQLPLLKPMSEIAGKKMAPLIGAHYLSRYEGGEGVLISGSDGVSPAKVLIIGAGNAGFSAAKIATGMGADVTVLNRSAPKLEELKKRLANAKTVVYSSETLRELIKDFDIVIGTVLIHGGERAPKLITREMIKDMKKGSVLVDIAIDQEASLRHHDLQLTPMLYLQREGVLHYCVANMPGAYPKTATLALSNATFPYVRKLANEGIIDAINSSPPLKLGVNVYKGALRNPAVAKTLNLEFKSLDKL